MKQTLRKTFTLKAFMFIAMLAGAVSGAWADVETIDFSAQGYANAEKVSKTEGENVLVTFTDGSTATAYYNTGTAVRIYGNGSATFTVDGASITEIVLTFASSSNAPSGSDKSIWSEEGTRSSVSNDLFTWKGNATSVSITRPSGSGHWRLQKAEVTFVSSNPNLKSADLSYAETEFTVLPGADFTAPTLANPNNLTVTYSSSNEDLAIVDENTGEVAIGDEEGTVTITAAFEGNDEYKAGSASYKIVINDPNKPGSENNPYTVEQALEVISALADGAKTANNVYVKGIVTQIDELSAQYGNATYWISDEGTEEPQLEVFRGKYLNNENITASSELYEGDVVIVYGQLQKYVKAEVTTPEIASDNYIVSRIPAAQKAEAGLAYQTESFTITFGDEFTAPALVNPNDLTVTYSSDKEEVATVDAEGAVTIVGVGTAKITASFAGDDDFKAGEASYTIVVKKQPTPIVVDGNVFVKVTTEDELADGLYLIVSEDGGVIFNSGLEKLDANNNGIEVGFSNGVIAANEIAKAALFKIVEGENGWTLLAANGNYVNTSKTSNSLEESENASENTITFDEEGNAVITSTSGRVLRFNAASNTMRFRYYASGQKPVQLYKLATMEVGYTREAAKGKFGTLCLAQNAVVLGAELYTIAGKADNTLVLAEENVVEAGHAYIIKATADKQEFIYTSDETAQPIAENGLVGVLEQTNVAEGAYVIYNNEVVKAGTDVTVGANRAYINLDEVADYVEEVKENEAEEAAVKLAISGTTTGVAAVKSAQQAGVAYDMTGRSVNAVKGGLYIVGGKKVVK